MLTSKILLLLAPAVWLSGTSAAAEPAPGSSRPAFGAKSSASPLPQSFLDWAAGAEGRAQDATETSAMIVQELGRSVVEHRSIQREAAAAKGQVAKCLKQGTAALTSLKAAPKSGAVASTLLATANSEFEAAQHALELLDGYAQGTAVSARHATVQLDGDDEFGGLTSAIDGAKQQIDDLSKQAEALPASQRERGRAEVARAKRALAKANAGLTKARKLERDLTALVTEPAPAAQKADVAKGLAEMDALSKRSSSACDLRTVDWKNARYSDPSGEFTLKQGAGRTKWGAVALDDVLYVDLDGNGSLEALVTIAEQLEPPDPSAGDTGNVMCNWEGSAPTFVFTAGASCKPQLLGTFSQGTSATRKVVGATVVVDAPYFTFAPTESRCIPAGLDRVTWRMSGKKLTSTSVKVR